MLAGKKLVITGVITTKSIAWTVAREAQQAGAEVVLTSFGRARRLTERAAGRLPETPEVLELDVNRPEDIESLAADLDSRWGRVDGVLHAIAHAPEDALGGNFLNAPTASAVSAFETSAVSLKGLSAGLRPLLANARGSVVALDFDATVAWPVYDWMGVSKAALEAIGRYLARDLGPHGVRVNLVSAGPIKTPAAGGIPGFDRLAAAWQRQAPLAWDVEDPTPVAQAVCFLLSDWSRGMTGEIVHVDGGYHAMGAPLVEDDAVSLPEPVGSGKDTSPR